MNLPSDLISACQAGNLIPIVGAGVSISICNVDGKPIFPSWKELLVLGMQEVRNQGQIKLGNLVEAQLEMNRYLDAAESIKGGLTGALWTDFIKRTFRISTEEIDQSSLALAKSIWKLSNQIITLNYDKVLQLANLRPTEVSSIDNSQKAELATFSRGENPTSSIWHLHGRIDNIDSIILTATSYEALYNEREDFRAALSTLQTIVQTRSLIFIGCSMDDAELLHRIGIVANIFNGNTRPHYVLTRRSGAQEIAEKLKTLPFKIVEFEDFGGPLIATIDAIAGKNILPEMTEFGELASTVMSSALILQKPRATRVAVLIHNPVGNRNAYPELRLEIEKLKCEKHFLPLSVSTLQELEDFDSVFIVTEWVKDRILVEDDFLSPLRITVSDLLDNINLSKTCGIFLFSNHTSLSDEVKAEISASQYPLALIPRYEKSRINSAFFKIFRKKSLNDEDILCSRIIPCIPDLGDVQRNIEAKSPLPNGIDLSSIRDFVGRSTDIRNLLRLVVEARQNDSAITLKGAGGGGKTALAKLCAIELSNRGRFSGGIFFVDCEFIESLEIFTKDVAQCFNLQYEKDFLNALKQRVSGQHLLILDNFETLLYLPTSSAILLLVSQLAEHVTVLMTSRDATEIPNEVIYELRRLTSEEGTELFVRQLGNRKITESDKKFIRERIVEDLLDNSPLAIKLITKSIPSGKDLAVLEIELKEDIFATSNIEYPFNADSDENVERKKSIYASINYSYVRLNEKEKKVFEVLSLFPDGINIELFKHVAQETGISSRNTATVPGSNFIVTDPLLKSLESKSMIQSSNGIVRHQSLLGKFADFRLRQREPTELLKIYESSFDYMYDFSSTLSSLKGRRADSARNYFDAYQKNFLRAILTAKQIAVSPERICEYLICVDGMAASGLTAYQDTLRKADFQFAEGSTEQLCIQMIVLGVSYYLGNFDSAIKKVRELLPREKYLCIPSENYIDRYIALSVGHLYGMEGEILDELILEELHNADESSYPNVLYRLGVFNAEAVANSDIGFFTLECKLSLGVLTSEEIDSFIRTRPKKYYLEILQLNYTRTKLIGSPLSPVDSLVPVNPYSVGIKHLITAAIDPDTKSADLHYRKALQSLEHIKFYLVDAYLLYSKFLKTHIDPRFHEISSDGLALSKLYHFRYLQYCFEELISPTGIVYDVSHYHLPTDRDYNKSISTLLRRNMVAKRR